jgi:RNA polymerase sigma-70 factor (ECF subfamily)
MTACTETQVTAPPSPRPAAATDAGTFEELFHGVYPKLAGWVRRLVDDDETAHEIASEAFTRLLSRWARVDSPQRYLFMIATNLTQSQFTGAPPSGNGGPSAA